MKRLAEHAPNSSILHCPCSYAKAQVTLLWYLKRAHTTSRWGHNNTIAPAALWCNHFSDTAPIHGPCSQPLNNCDCGHDDCGCTCRHTDTTAAVISLIVAVLLLVATSAAIGTMVLDITTTAVTTSCTLGCGCDCWFYSRSCCTRCE